jgi:hypothetical protein
MKVVTELCLSAKGFNNTFTNPGTGTFEQGAGQKLGVWVEELVTRYLRVMDKRLSQEKNQAECPILVRSLDRFHRRLTATSRLVSGLDMDIGHGQVSAGRGAGRLQIIPQSRLYPVGGEAARDYDGFQAGHCQA